MGGKRAKRAARAIAGEGHARYLWRWMSVMAPVQPYGHRVPMLLGGDELQFATAVAS